MITHSSIKLSSHPSIYTYVCVAIIQPLINPFISLFLYPGMHTPIQTYTDMHTYGCPSIHSVSHPNFHPSTDPFIHTHAHPYITHPCTHPKVHSSIHTYTLPSIYPSICSLQGPRREKAIVHSLEELTVV